MKKIIALILIVFFTLTYRLIPAASEVQLGLLVLSITATLWITEAINLTVTSLLVPVLATLLGIMPLPTALTTFADPIIFLFLGGFALASALHKHQIDQAIADRVLTFSNGKAKVACLLLFAVTAMLSMWISNTATTAMMLPIALGLLSNASFNTNQRLFWFVLLGVAYSASVGGIGTLVGSPPNAIAAAALGMTFADWAAIGMPLVVVLLPLIWGLLFLIFRPDFKVNNSTNNHAPPTELTSPSFQKPSPIEWDSNKVSVLVIFIITALLWIFGGEVSTWLNISSSFDSWVAIIAIVLLTTTRSVEWKDIEKTTDWGVLLLFGGGLTLGALLKTTGANAYIATVLSGALIDTHLLVLLFALTLFVIFMTEISSNTALTALLIPTFMSLADILNTPRELISITIAIAASCAFMLPVATPPNAIVFGTGYVPQKVMMKTGIFLNLTSTIVVTLFAWLVLAH